MIMIAFPLNWATGDKSQLVHEHAKRVKIILSDTQHNWDLAVQISTRTQETCRNYDFR